MNKKTAIRKLGFFESLPIKIKGYRDGRRGLPQKDENGQWHSPHLDKEIHTYAEFSSHIWGALQTELEPSYVRLNEISDLIILTKEQLQTAKRSLETAVNAAKATGAIRKNGESKLSDEQVSARRSKEIAKKLDPIKAHLDKLHNELTCKIEEFSKLRSFIVERNNSTKMFCNTMKDRFLQRIDVYWDSAMRKHAEAISLTPSIELVSHAESMYIEPHKNLLKTEELFKQILEKEENNG